MKKMALMVLVALLALTVIPPGASAAERKFNLKLCSSIPTKLPLMNSLPWFVDQVKLITNGTVNFKLYEPGALVPAFEVQEAASKNQIQASYSGAIYMSGKMPAAALFTSMPFGPNGIEAYGWYYFGNGTKLLQEMYDRAGYNLKVWPMVITSMESGGWFNKKVEKIEDFKGMRLRWPGLGGKVLASFGASVSTIPGGEIFPALEKGAIDGTEFSNPILDSALGFFKVAKYNYYPGWHQPSTIMEFTMNKEVWQAMSKSQQAGLEAAIMALNLRTIADCEANTGRILITNEKRGVQNLIYPPEVLRQLKARWLEIAKEESAKDPFFKKVFDDLSAYMTEYQVWECHSTAALPASCK